MYRNLTSNLLLQVITEVSHWPTRTQQIDAFPLAYLEGAGAGEKVVEVSANQLERGM